MGGSRRRGPRRKRVGKVSCYQHHGAWWVYYKEGQRQVRRRVGDQTLAEQVAAQVNAQLATAVPTMFSFTPLTVGELCRQFLEDHEHIRRSSLATIRRYRAALKHLEDFASEGDLSGLGRRRSFLIRAPFSRILGTLICETVISEWVCRGNQPWRRLIGQALRNEPFLTRRPAPLEWGHGELAGYQKPNGCPSTCESPPMNRTTRHTLVAFTAALQFVEIEERVRRALLEHAERGRCPADHAAAGPHLGQDVEIAVAARDGTS